MKKTDNENKSESAANVDIFNLTEVECPVGFDLFPGMVFTFFYRLQLAQAASEARQIFVGLTAEEKAKRAENFSLELATSLITRLPEGVPGLDPSAATNIDDARRIFREFFDSDNAVKQKLLSESLDVYFERCKNTKFFRGN